VSTSTRAWQIWIDTGGAFTDCFKSIDGTQVEQGDQLAAQTPGGVGR